MKPIYHLLLMFLASWVAIFISDIIFDKMIYELAFSLGTALVPFAVAASVMLIGYVLHIIHKSKWSVIIKIAWSLLIISLFFMYYGRIR